jgi:hypothetical protein
MISTSFPAAQSIACVNHDEFPESTSRCQEVGTWSAYIFHKLTGFFAEQPVLEDTGGIKLDLGHDLADQSREVGSMSCIVSSIIVSRIDKVLVIAFPNIPRYGAPSRRESGVDHSHPDLSRAMPSQE